MKSSATSLSPQAFNEALKKEQKTPSAIFIDVRSHGEYEAEHIEHVISIPLDTLQQNLSKLTNKKSIYITCKSGMRGNLAVAMLTENKLQASLYTLDGGILSWKANSLPVVTRKTNPHPRRLNFLSLFRKS